MFRRIAIATARAAALGLLAFTVTSACLSEARAGAFYLPERGARALSLGGAFVAGADDMNAQWMNPAGLLRLKHGFDLYLDLAVITSDQTFDRADDAEVMRKDPLYADGFPTASDKGGPFPDPSLGVASNFGLDDWMFALGVYGPYAGTNKWDDDGPQRYSLSNLSAVELFAQLSVAWRPTKTLSLGIGLQWIVTSLTQRLTISTYPGVFGWSEERDLDALAEVKADDAFTPCANFGVIWSPVDLLDIGLSAQLPAHAAPAGKLKVRKPSSFYFSDSDVVGDNIEVGLDFPLILRLGLRLHDEDLWSVELAGVYEGWSVDDTIDVAPGKGGIAFTNVPGIGTYTVKPFAIDVQYKDVISVRLGGSFRPGNGPVTFRAGGYYESGAPPDRTLTVLDIDGDKIGLGLGATFHLGTFTIDIAGAWIDTFERTVTNSDKTQVNPIFDADPKPYADSGPSTVGNGTYKVTNFIAALTFGAAL
ncbi:MAG: outer membrane protein transport protein [Myxococcota bacterium]